MTFDLLEYYNMVKENRIDIIYSGPIWANGVEGIAETLRKRMALDDLTLSASQSVFSVFVEQMNNMLMYSEDKQWLDLPGQEPFCVSSGIFVLGVKEKKYFLQSGNVMKSDGVSRIRERIDFLNTLDKGELRKLYKEEIKRENDSPDSRGAGIGLIEIARRASASLQYRFTPMGEGQTFFAMYVEIG